MQCPDCKTEVTPGEPFCDNCGRDLRDLQPPVGNAVQAIEPVPPQLPASPPATTAKLTIKDSGASYELAAGRALIVGRTDPIDGIYPDIDLTTHDTATGVSRQHASLHAQGGQWYVKDLNSTNYTVVNRQRVNPDQEFLLSNGDELRFGRVVTIFQSA